MLYDAVYVPGGADNVIALQDEPDAIHFLNEAWRHCKAIAFDADAGPVLDGFYPIIIAVRKLHFAHK
ncbi:hypothetical protein SIO70_26830 [Chitinophaga sancti]|uniref:hypothetical protein n=1 Tax=Chitinophaga sancti TaxID=1004 RepID=UPI002A74C495|nr:hypothetical protein [Chitinophaga sancti]WPQ61982.1 hypothetical protein SIO70_26830 [Chitinophaga sancti]